MRKIFQATRVGVCLLVACFTLQGAVYAAPQQKPAVTCRALLVHLFLEHPASTTCMPAQAASTPQTTTPPIASTICAVTTAKALWIYQNVSFGGYCIGFLGSGTALLSNYLMPNGLSWNHQASFFYAGCSPGAFSSKSSSIYTVHFTTYQHGNFPYIVKFSSGRLITIGNDDLEKITLDSNC